MHPTVATTHTYSYVHCASHSSMNAELKGTSDLNVTGYSVYGSISCKQRYRYSSGGDTFTEYLWCTIVKQGLPFQHYLQIKRN